MDINTVVELLVKAIAPEAVKKILSIDALNRELFDHFTKKTLKGYLRQRIRSFKTVKTLMHIDHPVEFEAIYQPVELNGDRGLKKYEKIEELFNSSNYISIIGKAGSGKTTFTKYIFLKCAKEKYKIPVIITFRDLKKNVNLKEAIMHSMSASENELESIERYLQKGKFLIILDGYDEKIENQFDGHQENIFDCLSKFSDNSYIITSRPYAGAERLTQFHVLKILPLSREDQIEFIKKQLSANNSRQEEIAAILESLDREYNNTRTKNFITEFLQNPLLLLLYIITFRYTNDVPHHIYIYFLPQSI